MSQPKRFKTSSVLFVIVVLLMIIPQTRQPIQVFINKGIALMVKPSVIEASERKSLSSYDWQLRELSGADFNFQTAKGKVIVINFWATWCPPCIAEMPSLEALYQKYKTNEDIVFLLVSNEEPIDIETFMTKKDYTFKVYQSLTEYPKDFNVSSIPRTFIVSKTGEIVIDKSGAASWNSERVISAIDELLKAF